MSSTALAIVEQSQVAKEVGGLTRQLLSLLPGPEAVRRFQRVTVQALVKNPDLLDCTPDSVVQAVMEAASMGLEPTGSVGGAHLVPFSVNTAPKGKPPKWEKRAQLIPDYRGVVRLVTRPRSDGKPSDVLSVEARAVKEGDQFAYTLGTDARVEHVPSLDAARSSKPTTHVYAIARLRSGGTMADVEDHAGIERVRKHGKEKAFSPWDSDWDEMAKKTIVKRLSKMLPVEPDVRAILAREDEPQELVATAGQDGETVVSQPRTRQLAARLAPRPDPVAHEAPQPAQDAPSAPEHAAPAPDAPDPAEEAVAREACDARAADGIMAGSVCGLAAEHTGAHKSADGSWPR